MNNTFYYGEVFGMCTVLLCNLIFPFNLFSTMLTLCLLLIMTLILLLFDEGELKDIKHDR